MVFTENAVTEHYPTSFQGDCVSKELAPTLSKLEITRSGQGGLTLADLKGLWVCAHSDLKV